MQSFMKATGNIQNDHHFIWWCNHWPFDDEANRCYTDVDDEFPRIKNISTKFAICVGFVLFIWYFLALLQWKCIEKSSKFPYSHDISEINVPEPNHWWYFPQKLSFQRANKRLCPTDQHTAVIILWSMCFINAHKMRIRNMLISPSIRTLSNFD